MNKSFKLALLGCASSCLMSAAYANVELPNLPGTVSISDIDLENRVCTAEETSYPVTITHRSLIPFAPVILGRMSIKIDEDDSFQDTHGDRLAVRVERGDCGSLLFRSCTAKVIFDPSQLSCADLDHPMVFEGKIARNLVVPYFGSEEEAKANLNIRFATTDLDADITLMGSLEDYAIIADDIIAGTDDDASALDAVTIVEENVSAAEDLVDGDDIVFNCEYGTCGFVEFPHSYAAFADAQAAWSIFRAAVVDEDLSDDVVVDCTNADYFLNLDGSENYIEVYPGVTCVQGAYTGAVTGSPSTAIGTYSMPEEIAFKGKDTDVFVFVFPDTFTGIADPVETSDTYDLTTVFNVNCYSKFSLTSTALGTTVDPENIFWILPDDSTTTFQQNTRFAGNIITADTINYGKDAPVEGSGPYILGGLYGLSAEVSSEACPTDEASPCPESSITVDGFTIDE